MGSKSQLYLIYADWCPHCQSFKNYPEDGSSKSAWENVKMQSKSLGCQTIEMNDEAFNTSAPAPLKQMVEGFPTLVLQKDGKFYKYQNERSSKEILKFVRAGGSSGGSKSVAGGAVKKGRKITGGTCPCQGGSDKLAGGAKKTAASGAEKKKAPAPAKRVKKA